MQDELRFFRICRAVLAEDAIDAAVCHGLDLNSATDMFLETMAGTAELLIKREGDTLAARREVGTPGGSTVRGVAALERKNVRTAFMDAYHDVLTRLSRPYHGAAASSLTDADRGAIRQAPAPSDRQAGRSHPECVADRACCRSIADRRR